MLQMDDPSSWYAVLRVWLDRTQYFKGQYALRNNLLFRTQTSNFFIKKLQKRNKIGRWSKIFHFSRTPFARE